MTLKLNYYTALALTLTTSALTLLSACGADLVDCGTGYPQHVDGERYCLYPKNLIIEGFKCPDTMLPHNVPGGVVCSPQDLEGAPLPTPLQTPFDDTVPWCLGDDCIPTPNNNTNNTSPHEAPPTPRDQDDFVKVYRHADYACVINKDDVATCWGPALATEPAIPATLPNVSELALTPSMLCSIEYGSIGCYPTLAERVFSAGFMSRMTYRDISTDGEIVCALGDYSEPHNRLHCGTVKTATNDQPALRIQGMINERFAAVDIKENISGRVQAICGVREDLTVHCRSEFGEFTKQGVYAEVKHWGGGSGGIACARAYARDIGGPIECWRLEDGMALPSPSGKFGALYSAFCGFNAGTQEVQCWDQLRQQAQLTPSPAPVTTIYKGYTRSFSVYMTPTELRWCAINLQGQLTCTDLSSNQE